MINPQKPVINPINFFNRFTALIITQSQSLFFGAYYASNNGIVSPCLCDA